MLMKFIERLKLVRSEIRETLRGVVQARDVMEEFKQEFRQTTDEIRQSLAELQRTQQPVQQATWTPPGHFYSPIVDPSEITRRHAQVFNYGRRPSNIDMRDEAQLALLRKMKEPFAKLPFQATESEGLRYYYDNPFFTYGDGIVLACMLMEFKPRRIIEVGSGFSSCVTMDVNDLFLGGTTEITFVEPFPTILNTLIRPEDRERYRMVASPVQDIDLGMIDTLQAGDVLFIDSTHVTKTGSDVNFEFFTILPRLASGVLIHFHDMFYPFEYPEVWVVNDNRSWNELYLMNAFLANNNEYEIVFFNDFMYREHRAATTAALPLFPKNAGGSLWLRKR